MNFGKKVKSWTVKSAKQKDEVITLVFKRLGTLIINRTPIGDWKLWTKTLADGSKVPAYTSPPPDYRPGSLVNNWHSGLGSPGILKPRNHNINGADSLSQLNAISQIAPGKLVYFANPLPYARRIEYGWSTQRPRGMVRISVAEFQRIVAKAVADVT